MITNDMWIVRRVRLWWWSLIIPVVVHWVRTLRHVILVRRMAVVWRPILLHVLLVRSMMRRRGLHRSVWHGRHKRTVWARHNVLLCRLRSRRGSAAMVVHHGLVMMRMAAMVAVPMRTVPAVVHVGVRIRPIVSDDKLRRAGRLMSVVLLRKHGLIVPDVANHRRDARRRNGA